MKFIIPSILIYVWYISFASEIVQIYDIAFSNSMIVINETSIYNHNITSFKEISLIFYSIIFMLIFSFLNLKLFKHKKLALVNGFINFFLTLVALTAGLVICSDLREAYLNGSEYFNMGMIYLSIRYLNIIFIGLLLYSIHKIILKYFNKKKWKQFFWLGLHVVIVWILSSEMLHWMNYFDNKNAYKLSLTLLWASYSLFAIVLGIWKRHKFLRLGAIALLAITLVKLFFYDIANLSQIQIIIVLVSVGILILIMSFLYNKYTKEIEE